MLKLRKILVTSFMLSSLFSIGYSVANAETGTEYTFTGGFKSSDVSDLKYVVSGGNSSYQKMMEAGVQAWNDVSSKVNVSYGSDGKVSVYKSTTSVSGLNGRIDPYYRNVVGGLSLDKKCVNIWETVDVFGFDNNLEKLNLDSDEKKAVYMHEMGHALSMAHNDSKKYLLMNTYTQDTVKALTLKSDDKGNLRIKWGK
ncbi:matrixin family metalloprotease [Brevibacterium sp. JNUCC-42]|nr:matrixin family metalloprotease [Brevibacillus laterosporus]QOS97834.1 matrixin family metalloprotease [Brevibacterium sp. JNUCC-42]